MKVKLNKDYRRFITLDEYDTVKEMIKDFDTPDENLTEYAKTAARIASGESCEILKASAEIAKNRRAWNQYSDHSGELDIWIECTAYSSYKGFYIVGAYLSDIWASCGDENRDELRGYMFIREFLENRSATDRITLR